MESINETNTEINSAMDELYSSTLENFIEGTIVKGTIVGLNNNDVVRALCGTANGVHAWISRVDAIST